MTERFWSKVQTTDGCWLWTAFRNKRGVGQFRVGIRMEFAPRVAWFLTNGEWPTLNVLHRCDNPQCVRPSHLFLGTQADNVADMHAKGRARHARGERQGSAKLTASAVRQIRKRYATEDVSQAMLANEFRVSQHTVSTIVRGTQWKHVDSSHVSI